MNDTNYIDSIRERSVYPLSIMSQDVLLETDPRSKLKNIIDLFEFSFKLLVVYGISIAKENNIPRSDLLKVISFLEIPSMGKWLTSLKLINGIVKSETGISLVHLDQKIAKTPLENSLIVLMEILEKGTIQKPRVTHLLNLLVEFRNNKIGHGKLMKSEAIKCVEPLQASLFYWILVNKWLTDRKMIYVERVEWREPVFSCFGIDLGTGHLLNPIQYDLNKPLRHDSVYVIDKDKYIKLSPMVKFEDEIKQFSIYQKKEEEGFVLRKI